MDNKANVHSVSSEEIAKEIAQAIQTNENILKIELDKTNSTLEQKLKQNHNLRSHHSFALQNISTRKPTSPKSSSSRSV